MVDADEGTVGRWARERGVKCFEPPIVHGYPRYVHFGCRCETCETSYRTALRRQKAQRVARQDQAPHGTAGGYINWQCRCDPCKKAGSLHNKRTAMRRKERLAAQSTR